MSRYLFIQFNSLSNPQFNKRLSRDIIAIVANSKSSGTRARIFNLFDPKIHELKLRGNRFLHGQHATTQWLQQLIQEEDRKESFNNPSERLTILRSWFRERSWNSQPFPFPLPSLAPFSTCSRGRTLYSKVSGSLLARGTSSSGCHFRDAEGGRVRMTRDDVPWEEEAASKISLQDRATGSRSAGPDLLGSAFLKRMERLDPRLVSRLAAASLVCRSPRGNLALGIRAPRAFQFFLRLHARPRRSSDQRHR